MHPCLYLQMSRFRLPQFRTARGFKVLALLTTSHAPQSPSSSFWSPSPALCQPSHPRSFWEHRAVRLGGHMSDPELSPVFPNSFTESRNNLVWKGSQRVTWSNYRSEHGCLQHWVTQPGTGKEIKRKGNRSSEIKVY